MHPDERARPGIPVSPCLGHEPDGSTGSQAQNNMGFSPVQGSTSSGFGGERASQGSPEKGATALGRKGRI